MKTHTTVFTSADELAEKTAEKIISIGHQAISMHGHFSWSLAGGKTPKMVYEVLAKKHKESIDWKKVHLFWGDERDVISTHPDSNFGMAKNVLMDPIGFPDANIHRIGTEEDCMLAAQQAEDDIKDFFGLSDGGFPKFDLILLGLGEDGHTASLFPGTDGITETKFLVMDNFVKKLGRHRVTFTFPTINHASNVLFLVSGKSKSSIIKQVLQGSTEDILPAQMVRPAGELYWYLDKEAASELQ
ncbi:MAG TPA: 6-phosphogluconolactonase [bacterium]|nr:6-phosphogluconolactonase [bacterium]HMY34902.1 6-phosphogluconolactonase [bacterium]HNB07923.1 6-phosphogluconolactonase [bacterium]HNB55735.1 6-phosphogluconolactonase [bacterium]HNC48438.1 6-phosphogluconolactonase [bacterium]